MISAVKGHKMQCWRLGKFLVKLFNHCFPPDFRLTQHNKLDSFRQGNLLIQEYAAELMFLFRTVRESSRCEQVDKLWNGLKPMLQKALWLESLDPRTAGWKEVIQVAKRHEIADQIHFGGFSQYQPPSSERGRRQSNYPTWISNWKQEMGNTSKTYPVKPIEKMPDKCKLNEMAMKG
jgi:hypothetical protein